MRPVFVRFRTNLKRCGTCGEWGTHFCADHPGDATPAESGSNIAAEGEVDTDVPSESNTSANIGTADADSDVNIGKIISNGTVKAGIFSRLKAAGLL